MAKYIFMLFLGIALVVAGIFNLCGNISLIKWFNRFKVDKSNIKIFGKLMGIGYLIIGLSVVVTAIFQMIYNKEVIYFIIVGGFTIGLIICLYAEIKYNKIFW